MTLLLLRRRRLVLLLLLLLLVEVGVRPGLAVGLLCLLPGVSAGSLAVLLQQRGSCTGASLKPWTPSSSSKMRTAASSRSSRSSSSSKLRITVAASSSSSNRVRQQLGQALAGRLLLLLMVERDSCPHFLQQQ
jgi:hypothetical protein